MPKDPSSRSLLSPKSRGTLCRPYPSNGRGVSQGSSSNDTEEVSRKDWEESTCPICMECPHNAVLLLCSSHDKGCRPYMCDTSYRHSNCLDQYKKAKTAGDKNSDRDSEASLESVTGAPVNNVGNFELPDELHPRSYTALALRSGLPPRREGLGGSPQGRSTGIGGGVLRSLPLPVSERTSDAEFLTDASGTLVRLGLDDERVAEGAPGTDASEEVADLLCPLCRGKVFGWKVIEPARHQLNRKPRGCAQEACSFTGTYKELREHARNVHPSARPSDIDPVRQRDWRLLERQRDLGDVLSTISSAMPGATVLGDYVIDDDEEEHEDECDDSDFPGDDGNWWTVFLLFQVFGPGASFGPGRTSRIPRGPPGSSMMRSALWGDLQGAGIAGGISNVAGNNVNVDGGLGGSTSRRRRSRPRSRGGDVL